MMELNGLKYLLSIKNEANVHALHWLWCRETNLFAMVVISANQRET